MKNPGKKLGLILCHTPTNISLSHFREETDDPRKHPFFKSINFQRLEAGLIRPPFVPEPSTVYCKDLGDNVDFSEVQGIDITDKDKQFYREFVTGAITISWQEELIEMCPL